MDELIRVKCPAFTGTQVRQPCIIRMRPHLQHEQLGRHTAPLTQKAVKTPQSVSLGLCSIRAPLCSALILHGLSTGNSGENGLPNSCFWSVHWGAHPISGDILLGSKTLPAILRQLTEEASSPEPPQATFYPGQVRGNCRVSVHCGKGRIP